MGGFSGTLCYANYDFSTKVVGVLTTFSQGRTVCRAIPPRLASYINRTKDDL